MTCARPQDCFTRAALALGTAVPFVYYGIQAAAAPHFPDFSFVRTTASELGSDLSRHPAVFNVGIMAMGAATLVAALGFLFAFRRLGVGPVRSLPASAAVALNGVQTMWAGYHPLPDPRHGGHPVFVVGMVLLPVLLAAALWGRRVSPLLKAYLLATLLLLAVIFPIMSGISGIDTHAHRGLQQRAFALTVFPPIGVAAFVLSRRVRAGGGPAPIAS